MEFFHGQAIAKTYISGVNAYQGQSYPITAWLPDEDITCVLIDGTLIRMDLITFNKWFEKKE